MESDSSERKWNVTTHLDTKHPICPICFSRLTSLKNILKHIYEKHTNNKLIPEEYENTEDSDEDDDGMIVVRRYSNNVKLKKTKVTLTEDTKIKVDGKPKTLIAGGKILLSRKMEVVEDEKKEKKKKNEGKIDPFLGYGEGKKTKQVKRNEERK